MKGKNRLCLYWKGEKICHSVLGKYDAEFEKDREKGYRDGIEDPDSFKTA